MWAETTRLKALTGAMCHQQKGLCGILLHQWFGTIHRYHWVGAIFNEFNSLRSYQYLAKVGGIWISYSPQILPSIGHWVHLSQFLEKARAYSYSHFQTGPTVGLSGRRCPRTLLYYGQIYRSNRCCPRYLPLHLPHLSEVAVLGCWYLSDSISRVADHLYQI